MKKSHTATLIAVLIALTGCGGMAVNFSPFVYTCNDWDQLKASDQETLRSNALDILKKMSKGETRQILESSHPLFKNSVTQEQFDKVAEDIKPRLEQVDRAKLVDGRLLTLTNVTNQFVDATCGLVDSNSPEHLKVRALSDGQKIQRVALVMFEIPDQSLKRLATLQLSEHEGQYKLIRADLNPSAYNGKNAQHYARVAEGWLTSKKMLSAYIAFSMARNLSQRGTTVQTGEQIKLTEQLTKLENNQELKAELKSWKVDDAIYEIFRLELIETLDDILPWVVYISHEELGEVNTSKEAALLMEYFKKKYPELSEEFEWVLFQAHAEPPTDPNRQYKFYRVPIRFKDKR